MKTFTFLLLIFTFTGAAIDTSVGRSLDPGEFVDPEDGVIRVKEFYLRGDPEDLTPEHPGQVYAAPHHLLTKPKPPGPPKKVLKPYKPTKGDTGEDLAVAATRQRPRQHSYSRQYNPQPRHYSTHNGHSNNKKKKGGYENSNSYKGSKGYSSQSSFDRANKGDYGDSDHQEYRHKDGGHKSGGHSGGGRSGGRVQYGNYGGEYGDDGNSYTSPGGDYK